MGLFARAPKRVGNGTCGCGRSIPSGRVHCPRCQRTTATDTARNGASGPCLAQVYRNGVKQACGGNVRNGTCPSPDH